MTFTSEERREMAENLRHLTIGHSIQYKEQFFDELAEVVVGFEDYHDFVPLKQLARAAGVNLSSLSHAISNGREVKMNLLLNLAEAMGEDPRDVVRKKVER